MWKARGYLGRLGCADRVKLKAEELRFTAGETFHSRYPLHVFQTNPQTPRTCREGKVVLTLAHQLYHPFISSSRNNRSNVSSIKRSQPLRLRISPAFVQIYQMELSALPQLITSKMQMTTFTPLWEAPSALWREKGRINGWL